MHNPIFLQTMLKAYKYRIYPSEEQKILINKSMGCVRYLYNKALDAKVKHYEKTGKSLSCFDLITGMLKEEKSKHEWLLEPYSQVLQMPFRNLDNAFNRFFHKQSKFPKFKSKHRTNSIQYPQHVKVDFKRSLIKLLKLEIL